MRSLKRARLTLTSCSEMKKINDQSTRREREDQGAREEVVLMLLARPDLPINRVSRFKKKRKKKVLMRVTKQSS